MEKLYFVLLFCCVASCFGKGCLKQTCGTNEEKKCVFFCPPERTCKNRNDEYSCLAVAEPCENKCVCKKGYYRNFLGTCITSAECDKCPGKNEFFACDSACDNECFNLSYQNRTNCPIQNITCNQKCYCDDGYARDEKGTCIPISKCKNV